MTNLFSMLSGARGGERPVVPDYQGDYLNFDRDAFRSYGGEGGDPALERCVANNPNPTAAPTCSHDIMLRNIETEIETLTAAFLSASSGSYGSNDLEGAFSRLLNAHNKYGYQNLPCKLKETTYYKADKRVGAACNLRTSKVNDAHKQFATFQVNFLSFHGCSYHSCDDNQSPMSEFTTIMNTITRLIMEISVVIPYPDGLPGGYGGNNGGYGGGSSGGGYGGGNSIQTGSNQIPKASNTQLII